MGLTGDVTVTWQNAGAVPVTESYTVQVYIEDKQTNTITELGTASVITPLNPGETGSVVVSINGTMVFKDQPVYAFVDSQNAIIESNENNNITHSMADCQMEPSDPGSFAPVLEWEWTGSEVLPSHNKVDSTPIVAQLTDDDVPAIIVNTYNQVQTYGILRAFRGDGTGEIFTITDPAHRTEAYAPPAVGDIDGHTSGGDPEVEIIALHEGLRKVLVFGHDGTFKWESEPFPQLSTRISAPSLADIDGDGVPEIIIGNVVLNNDGTVRWVGTAPQGYGGASVADLTLNGVPEIVSGYTAYDANGDIFWSRGDLPALQHGFTGIANFDDDPFPEVVLVSGGYVHVLEHTGETEWSVRLRDGGRGGSPTIADYDHDGKPEIGVAGAYRYLVFEEVDGKLVEKWSQPVQDASSHITGSSVFDFNGDGSVEVLYADEQYFRIYKGETGEVLFAGPMGSHTSFESPIVADVDGDNKAEVVVVANPYRGFSNTGFKVFGDANNAWVNTRKIWNQHSYHITNVNDDGTIPQFEANSWDVHNTYRCNLSSDALACEDYSASYLRVDTTNYPVSIDVIARIGNAGAMDLGSDLTAAFYDGDPDSGGTLIDTTVIAARTLPFATYQDVSVTWIAPSYGMHDLYVVVDDDGAGRSSIRESDETNNIASSTLFIGRAPVADAGADQEALPGAIIVLDGSNSYDPAGYTPLTYAWQFIEIPEGSAAVLDDAASMTPSFTADLIGTYLVQLRVENTQGIHSAVDSVSIYVPASTPSTVSIVAPADGTEAPLDGSLTILAEAYDADGAIVNVEFYAQNITFDGQNTLFGEVDSAPYSVPWTIVEPGIHEVIARAYGDSGVWTDSSPVHLIVQNGQPEMLSEPTYCAPIGALYSYDVEAADPNGDTLTYSLEYEPDGMTIDAVSGLITWTPTAAQVGQHDYRVIVEDGRGAGAGQTVMLYVPDADNTPPQITSEPEFTTRVEREYVYDVAATDADDDPLTFRLMTAPDGMSIEPSTGLITWMPLEEQIGTHTVTVVADDGRNGLGGQTYSLTVNPPNVAPMVTFIQPATGASLEEGRSVTLQVEASDSDGSIAQVEFYVDDDLLGTQTAPGTQTSVYELAWTAAGLGEHTIYAIACDNEGASAQTESVAITVVEPLPDTIAPIVEVTATPQRVQPGDPVSIQISISDASPIESVSVTINGVPLTLSDNQASYTVPANDFYTVVAQATDSAGNTGTGQTVFRAFDGSDDTPPVVDLADAVEFQCRELAADQYNLTGSVQDVHPVHYTLLTREKGVSSWDTLAEGVISPLEGGQGGVPVSAAFDPTIYRNGIHELRLWAQDLAGNEAFVDGCLLLDGRFKVGQASIGGMDVNIPELGFPLLVGRVYDNRSRRDGSFGPGWSLPHEAANVQAEYTYAPSEGWGEEARGSFLTTYYIISQTRKVLVLRLGDGAVFTFRMELSPKSSLLYPIMDASFPLHVIYTPQDGTQATLEPIGVSHEVFLLSENGGTLMDWEGRAYAPTRFKLTLEDGTVYIINQQTGIERITDPYGHQISYSDTQIAHSSGDVLTIERDTSSRVERMTDQLGRTIEYHYDEHGMLEQVIQKGEGSYATRVLEHYAYQQGVAEQPVLQDILAPDGTRLGTFEYDSQGRKTGLIDHEGNRVLFGYDAPEHHYTVTDRRGNPTEYTYDSDGNVTAVTDAEDHTETYSYDADGNVLAHTNKLGYTTASTYDEDGNVLTETDPLGNTSTFTYDEDGNKLTATDPLGHTTSFMYDAHGHALTRQDALGHVTQFAYDEDGNLTATTNALNQTTSLSYDSQGNMLTKTDPLGNSVALTYDIYGNVIQSQDEMGNVTTKAYDGQGYVRTITDALGHTTTMDYHHSGKVTEYTDAAGKTTQNTFDANGNLLTTTDPSGSVFGFEYDENEQPTITTSTITTANGVETVTLEKVYDSLNQVTEQIDADGLSTKAEYDALGRQTATIDKLGNRTEISYDARNLPTKQVGPDDSSSSSSYDVAGRMTAQTDALGRTTQYAYDAVGNVTHLTNPDGTSVDYEYDALGRLLSTTSSTGLSTSREYDAAGRLIAETDVLGRTTRYEYYPDGKRKKMIDPRDNVFEFEYDEGGHQTAMRFPDGSSVTYQYNEQGKKIAETDQLEHTTSFAWNDLGLLQQMTDPLHHTTRYTYNEIGNLLSQTDANEHTTRLSITRWDGGSKRPIHSACRKRRVTMSQIVRSA